MSEEINPLLQDVQDLGPVYKFAGGDSDGSDAEGTDKKDGSDGGDSDGSDAGDADGTDAGGSGDGDGTDKTDGDGTDNA